MSHVPKSKDEKEAMKRIRKCKKEGSKKLNLCGLKIKEFPLDVFDLGWLEELWCGTMGLVAYPDEFHRLTNLQFLHLGDRELATLPTSICKMAWLKSLILGIGDETELSECLEGLRSCEKLKVKGGQAIFLSL